MTASRRNKTFTCWLAAVIGAVIVLSAPVAAATSITNLGKPTKDLGPLYFPLGGFHHSAIDAASHGKAELVFIGTLWDRGSALERWSVVKALDQFGTLSNVTASTDVEWTGADVATFDWSQAGYRSPYLTFIHFDVNDRNKQIFQRPSGIAEALVRRYAPPLVAAAPIEYSKIPLVAVGTYLQTASRIMVYGSLERTIVPTPGGQYPGDATLAPLSFSEVQQALIQAKDPPSMDTVENVNAETNIITALICHADGKKPASVCGRPVIKTILKSVK